MSIRTMPEYFGQGEWVGNTTLHPLGMSVLVVCVFGLLTLKRDKLLQPFFLLLCFVSPAQRIVLAGADFNFFRIAILVLFARIFLKKEMNAFHLKRFDVIFFLYTGVYSLVYAYSSGSLGDPLARGVEISLLYIVFRSVIVTTNDIKNLFKFIAVLSIPVCCFFIVESQTGRNFFSILGGVPEYTRIREGRLRCQGPFPHPIIAGVFWAILFPMFISMYLQYREKIYVLACISSIVIVLTTASSTTLLALLTAPVFMALFYMRRHLKMLFYLGVALVICLHLFMNAPIWHLLSRVGAVGGSTSHFRYMLIDKFFEHSNEWFLLGTNSTAHWFFGAQDLTNQFVLVGVRSGILGLALFIALLWGFYLKINKVVMIAQQKMLAWGIFSSVSVACVSFLGVSYFGQAVYIFNMFFPITVSFYLHSLYLKRELEKLEGEKENG